MLNESVFAVDGLTAPGGNRIGDVEVEVRHNEIAKEWKDPGVVDGPTENFLRWPTLVELGAAKEPVEQFKALTGRVVKVLWNAGVGAVASCDFEDELPYGGGMDRLRTNQPS